MGAGSLSKPRGLIKADEGTLDSSNGSVNIIRRGSSRSSKQIHAEQDADRADRADGADGVEKTTPRTPRKKRIIWDAQRMQKLDDQKEELILMYYRHLRLDKGMALILSSLACTVAYASFLNEYLCDREAESPTRGRKEGPNTLIAFRNAMPKAIFAKMVEWLDIRVEVSQLDTDVSKSERRRNTQAIFALHVSLNSISALDANAFYSAESYQMFLDSRFYKEWRANARALTVETVLSKAPDPFHSLGSPSTAPIVAMNPVVEALSVMPRHEVNRLSHSSAWLGDLITAVEDFPLGISITNAGLSSNGYEYVYVNKKFADITQYTRSEIIGKNPRFLQCEQTDTHKLACLRDSLQNMRRPRLTLKNRKKDGSLFKNHMTMKVIRDNDDKTFYIICLHVDMSDPESSSESMEVNDAFLRLLPPYVGFDDEVALDDIGTASSTNRSGV
jgi:PAS domain S-box-containing protein